MNGVHINGDIDVTVDGEYGEHNEVKIVMYREQLDRVLSALGVLTSEHVDTETMKVVDLFRDAAHQAIQSAEAE